MHIAAVVENVPNPTTSGGALTAWTVIQVFLEKGHRVTACLLLSPSSMNHSETKFRIEALRNQGIETIPVKATLSNQSQGGRRGKWHNRWITLSQTLHPSLSNYYPWVSMVPQMETILSRVRPDVIFTYHLPATAATYGIHIAPRMAAIGDPDYLVSRYRSQLFSSNGEQNGSRETLRRLFFTMKTTFDAGNQPKLMTRLLLDNKRVGFFAAHHAAEVRRRGIKNCFYFRTPIPDSAGMRWKTARARYESHPNPKILLIGHVQGTATLAGLYLFARETLPILEGKLGADCFEVHVVGGDSLPSDLSRLLNRPSVKIRGHIEPADDEFLSSDILLVPTPFELGIRVRILVGWSFGCCVVAHKANTLGIPEMVHEENALLASDGRSLAETVIRALGDPSLRNRLGKAGRETYERFFTPSTAGGKILAELESIVEQGASL